MLAVTIPAALRLIAVWAPYPRHTGRGVALWVLAVSAVAALFSPTVPAAGLVRAASVAAGRLIHRLQGGDVTS